MLKLERMEDYYSELDYKLKTFKHILTALLGQNKLKSVDFAILYNIIRDNLFEETDPIPYIGWDFEFVIDPALYETQKIAYDNFLSWLRKIIDIKVSFDLPL